MAAGGSTGPLRGGYYLLQFATQLLATAPTSAGYTLGTWTVPTGARLVIDDIQAACEYSGSDGASAGVYQINVFQGTTSVLSSVISLASGSSSSGTLTAAQVPVESAVAITATGNAGGAGSVRAAQHVTVSILCHLSAHPNSIFDNFGYANPTTQPSFGP